MWVGNANNMKNAFNTVNYAVDQVALVLTPRKYIHVELIAPLCIYLAASVVYR